MSRTFLVMGGVASITAACGGAPDNQQFLRYASWSQFQQSAESQYTVTCGPLPAPALDQCIRDYEARGYVRIPRPIANMSQYR